MKRREFLAVSSSGHCHDIQWHGHRKARVRRAILDTWYWR